MLSIDSLIYAECEKKLTFFFLVLTVSAIYLAVLGVGFMLAPREIGIDAVPADAPQH